MAKKTAARKKTVKRQKDILKTLVEKFGDAVVITPDSEGVIRYPPVEIISTRSHSVNWVLGRGGIPRARITLIYGKESSGKSTLCNLIMSDVQQAGGRVALIDAETSVDKEYLSCCRVDLNKLVFLQPDTAEQAYGMIEKIVLSNQVDLIVVDSVAALITKAELEGDIEDQYVAIQARVNARWLKRLNGALRGTKTAIVLVQQIRDQIGGFSRFGPQINVPGGKALKHWSSIMLETTRIKQIKTGTHYKGFVMRARTTKNKVAPPFRSVEIPVMVEKGVDAEQEYVDLAVKSKALTKHRGIYYLKKAAIGVGYTNTYAAIMKKVKLKDYVDSRVVALLAKWGDLSGDASSPDEGTDSGGED